MEPFQDLGLFFSDPLPEFLLCGPVGLGPGFITSILPLGPLLADGKGGGDNDADEPLRLPPPPAAAPAPDAEDEADPDPLRLAGPSPTSTCILSESVVGLRGD